MVCLLQVLVCPRPAGLLRGQVEGAGQIVHVELQREMDLLGRDGRGQVDVETHFVKAFLGHINDCEEQEVRT